MVIWLVPQGNYLFPELLETLAVNLHTTRGWSGWRIVTEDVILDDVSLNAKGYERLVGQMSRGVGNGR